jgi:hypothetical protein
MEIVGSDVNQDTAYFDLHKLQAGQCPNVFHKLCVYIMYETWGFHGGADFGYGLLNADNVHSGGVFPTLRKKLLSPSLWQNPS